MTAKIMEVKNKEYVNANHQRRVHETSWAWAFTCVQQFPDDAKVGVGDAVVQGRVAVAVGHVGYVLQHGLWNDTKSGQVVLHRVGVSGLLAGHGEPLLLEAL